MKCPLDKTEENESRRLIPQNSETALCFQLHDFLRVAYAAATVGGFNEALERIETTIQVYKEQNEQSKIQ